MQEKGKKKIIDNAGALQKKYAWKSEKTPDTKKAPQDKKKKSNNAKKTPGKEAVSESQKSKKKPAAACPYAKNVAAVIIRECPMNNSCRKNRPMCAKTLGITVKSCRSSEWKIRIITEIKYTQCLMWSAGENMQTEADVPQETDMQRRHRAA